MATLKQDKTIRQ